MQLIKQQEDSGDVGRKCIVLLKNGNSAAVDICAQFHRHQYEGWHLQASCAIYHALPGSAGRPQPHARIGRGRPRQLILRRDHEKQHQYSKQIGHFGGVSGERAKESQGQLTLEIELKQNW